MNMVYGIILKWLVLLPLIYSVATIDVKPDNGLQSTNSASHARFKRYHYPKPHIWMYPSSVNQEVPYNYPQNQANAFQSGYHYYTPGTNFDQIGGPFIVTDQQRKEHYSSLVNDPRFMEPLVQIQPNVYFNEELTYSRLPTENDSGFLDSQPAQENVPNQDFSQTGSPLKSNVGERFASPTMGDDQGAFISSDIFGLGFDGQNFTVSPTGLLISRPEIGASGGTAFGGSASIPCNVAYQKPSMPDFRAAGRRISDVKCYEYIWELRIRSDMETRNMQCNKARSKRSQNWPQLNWSQQRWPQENWHSQAGSQHDGSFQTIWSQQNMSQQSLYNQSDSRLNNSKTEVETELTGSAFGIAFKEAEPEEFPHMAAIGWRGVSEEYVFKCGGSLISHNFVLTAAHCTASGPDPSITDIVPRIARIGDTNIGFRADGQIFTQKRRRRQARDPGRLDVGIINIITHEQYNPNMRYFDIALFELEYELEFNKHLQPACLWTDPNTSDRIRKAVAAGWGIVDLVTSRTTLDLQAGELDIIDTPNCNRLLQPSFGKKLSQVVDHQICAGKLSGGIDVCQGDSGGPLQVKIQLPIKSQGSMHTILGIISAGVGCAKPDTPGIYTRITSFVDWIEGYVWP